MTMGHSPTPPSSVPFSPSPLLPSPSLSRGRFAPSPTGPLHFGSLLAAFGSWLMARKAGGEWLVRVEDLDPPREIPGAADDQLRTLERFGLVPDGTVLRQSDRDAHYREALERQLAGGDRSEERRGGHDGVGQWQLRGAA